MTPQIPVLNIGSVLLVSIHVELNDRVAIALKTSILERIEETWAPGLIIDITALGVVDSFVARVLNETVQLAEIMDTRAVLVGMQPEVAVTLTEMGLELEKINTAIDVEVGLEKIGYRLMPIASHAEQNTQQAEEVHANRSHRI